MASRCLVALLVAAVVACGGDAARPAGLAGAPGRAAVATHGGDAAPWFCHGIGCPAFEVLDKTSEYELRAYNSTAWAATTVTGMNYTKAVSTGFERLFGYISGANEDGVKIPMTAPVIATVTPGQGPACESNFTVGFYQPKAAPPAPTSPDVFVLQWPAFKAYAAQFGGFASQDDILKHAADLGKTLESEKIKFDSEHFVSAAYDPPFRVLHRHNEVWFKAM